MAFTPDECICVTSSTYIYVIVTSVARIMNAHSCTRMRRTEEGRNDKKIIGGRDSTKVKLQNSGPAATSPVSMKCRYDCRRLEHA